MATPTGCRAKDSQDADHGKDDGTRAPFLQPKRDVERGINNPPVRFDKRTWNWKFTLLMLSLSLVLILSGSYFVFDVVNSNKANKDTTFAVEFEKTSIPTTMVSSHKTPEYVGQSSPDVPETRFDANLDNLPKISITTISSHDTTEQVDPISPESSRPANVSTDSPGVYAAIEIREPEDFIELEINNDTTIQGTKFSEVTNLTVDVNVLCLRLGGIVREQKWDSLPIITLPKVKYLQVPHSSECTIATWCLRWHVPNLEHMSISNTAFNLDVFTAFVTFLKDHKYKLKSVLLSKNYFCSECHFSDDLKEAVGMKIKDSVKTQQDLQSSPYYKNMAGSI